MKALTGVICTARFKAHRTGESHPESPSRIDAVERAVRAGSLRDRLVFLEPRSAKREEVLLVHSERLYQEVLGTRGRDVTFLDADTTACSDSADVALLAVGSTLACVDAVLEGRVDNAFAFVRPPGHHAKPDKSMGFCLFNNVAVSAQYALRARGLRRVLIVDFDVHHGNGTQKAFYTSPEVLYVSTHQWPHYPGTGGWEEAGKDEGEGYTINVPMPAGMGDSEVVRIYRETVGALGREFAPDLVLVSAGFDAHRSDPLGDMQLTSSGYAAVAREILGVARSCCGGKVVFCLEGGYDVAGLEASIISVLEILSGQRRESDRLAAADSAAEQLIHAVHHAYGRYWPCLGASV